ncbi:MAG: GNAT family N-acetyltransferase [Candidatus Woesearchaeota archaeon]
MGEICTLSKKDFEDIVTVDYESDHQGDKERNITKEDMTKELKDRFLINQELFFGYKENNELLGYITFKPFFPGHKHCEIYWLAVRKEHQNKGIGSKLLGYIELYAKEHNFRKICLYTGKDMLTTRKFYENRGYSFVNEFQDYYGFDTGNTTAVLYAKKL